MKKINIFCFGFGQVAKNFIKKINTKNIDIKLTVTSRGKSDQKTFDKIRKNIILKKGGVLTNQTVNGKEVIVTKVTKKNNGSTKIIVKPTDGTGFYKVIKSVSINFEEAIKSGEIRVKEDS